MPLPTKLPTTMLPSGTPTTSNNNNMITYIYPENSRSPPRSQRQPRGYFNYDSSQQSLYGPGYPVIGYDNKNELVVQYANNLWKLYRPPLPIPTSTAIAITNNLDNLNNDNTDYQNSPYNYYYWDEFGPNNYGFGRKCHYFLTDFVCICSTPFVVHYDVDLTLFFLLKLI